MSERIKLLDSELPKVMFSGPLSRDATYTLYIAGPVRRKEMDNLIRVLEMQREWLDEAERVAPADENHAPLNHD